MTVTDFLARLDAVKGSSPNWTAQCPAHDDARASLSVGLGRHGDVVLHCHAGCAAEAVMAALGLELRDLFADGAGNGHHAREIIATYDYTDEQETLLFQVVRFAPKDFRQRRPARPNDPPDVVRDGWVWSIRGVQRVLYRLPAVGRAIAAGRRVFLVEGERDVAAIEAAGYTATCNPGGAGKWRPAYGDALRGARVVVVADRDEPGYAHARAVAAALQGVARRVALVEPAEGKDVSEHLAAGRTLAELVPVPEESATRDAHETTAERNRRIRGAAVELLTAPQQVGSWGWRDLDRLIGGLVAGWFYAIGARPSNGKTCLLLNLLSRLREDRVATLVFGTEMAPSDLLTRWAAMRLGLDELHVFAGHLTEAERARMEQEIAYLTDAEEVTFSEVTRLDLRRLGSEIALAFDARTGPPPRVIVLDHLHRITQDREELEGLAKELKEIAKERRVAMLVACQLSREKDVGPLDLHSPPSLSRYKGSAAIEENADIALGLYRPLRPATTVQQRRSVAAGQLAVTECEEPNTMSVVCLKHRFRGKAAGRSVWLTVTGSRLESRAFAPVPPPNAGDAWEPEDDHAAH